VHLIAAQPARSLDALRIGRRPHPRLQPGTGISIRIAIGVAFGSAERDGMGTAGIRGDPACRPPAAVIREEPDAALLAREPALVLGLSLALTLPIAADLAPLAALVDHSHVLLTSKETRRNGAHRSAGEQSAPLCSG
jgi:hypothetical protein